MRLGYRIRLVLNAVNGSTLLGLLVATIGRAQLSVGDNGLFLAERYRLPVPAAPAFTVGNGIVTKLDRDAGAREDRLFAHAAPHATPDAWGAGPAMVPPYLIAAGVARSPAGALRSAATA